MMKFIGSSLATICTFKDNDLVRLGTSFCFIKGSWFVIAKHVVWDEDQECLRNNLKLVTAEKKLKMSGPYIVESVVLHPDYDLEFYVVKNHFFQHIMTSWAKMGSFD